MYGYSLSMRWSEPISLWLAWLTAAGEGSGTVKLRKSQIARLARAFPGSSPWELTLDDLACWLGGHHWSGSTIRSHRSALRGFYSWARATGRNSSDPSEALPRIKSERTLPRPASEGSIAEAKLSADCRDTLMIRLGAELGMRACEIAVCHSSDLSEDLLGVTLLVHGKGGKQRNAYPSDSLIAAISGMGEGFLFPGRVEGHLSAAYVSKRLSWALGPGVVGHQLRHRFATVSYARGGRDIRAVQEALGHVSLETTAIYTKVPDESRRAAFLAAAS